MQSFLMRIFVVATVFSATMPGSAEAQNADPRLENLKSEALTLVQGRAKQVHCAQYPAVSS